MLGLQRYGLFLFAGVFLMAALLLPIIVWAIPESMRIPVVEDHEGDPPDAALFSHWEHSQFKCYSCHWSVFPQYPEGFTHDDMDEGRYCGACHDGTVAWEVDDLDVECVACHVKGGHRIDDEADEAIEEEPEEEQAEPETAPETAPADEPDAMNGEAEIEAESEPIMNEDTEAAGDTEEDLPDETSEVSPPQEEE